MSPSVPTVYSCPTNELNEVIRERNAISGEVFFQAMTRLLGPIRSLKSSLLSVAVKVSLFGVPPSAGIR